MRAVQQLSLARDLGRVQEIVRTTARELVHSDGATFVLRDDGQCFYADEDAIEPLWKGRHFPLSACISGWTILNHEVAVVPDIYADDRIPHEAYRPTFVRSLVMVPIRSTDPVGAIGSYWAEHHEATGDEIELLQALADATSVALENVRMYEVLEKHEQAAATFLTQAVTDELTGLLNRRGFFASAGSTLDAALSDGRGAAVVYVDVDGLKPVNDRLGHHAGDALLTHVAMALRSVLGDDDVVARLGGDEFCALLVGSDHARSVPALLQERFTMINAGGSLDFDLAASVGLIEAHEHPGATVDELLLRADERMYVDKRARASARSDGPPDQVTASTE